MVNLETTRRSAEIWFPVSMGGTGDGDDYRIHFDGNASSRNVPGWVKADGRGAGYGMVTWALTGGAVLGPFGALGGLIGGSVLGAAFSSLDYNASN